MNCFILIFLTAQMFLMIDEQTFQTIDIIRPRRRLSVSAEHSY